MNDYKNIQNNIFSDFGLFANNEWIISFLDNCCYYIQNNLHQELSFYLENNKENILKLSKDCKLIERAYDNDIIESIIYCFDNKNLLDYFESGLFLFDSIYVRNHRSNLEAFLTMNVFGILQNDFYLINNDLKIKVYKMILHIYSKRARYSKIIKEKFGYNFLEEFESSDVYYLLRGLLLKSIVKNRICNDKILFNIFSEIRYFLTLNEDDENIFDIHQLRLISFDIFHYLIYEDSFPEVLEQNDDIYQIISFYLENDFPNKQDDLDYKYSSLLILSEILSIPDVYLDFDISPILNKFFDTNYFPNSAKYKDINIIICKFIRKYLNKCQVSEKYTRFLQNNGLLKLKNIFVNGDFDTRKECVLLCKSLVYGPIVVSISLVNNGYIELLSDFLTLESSQTRSILKMLISLITSIKFKNFFSQDIFNEYFLQDYLIEPIIELCNCKNEEIVSMANNLLELIGFKKKQV